MNNNYKYYKHNGKLMRLRIEQDDEPFDPRHESDCNIGEIVCFGTNYGYLSDKRDRRDDAEDFFKNLCMKYLTEEQIETLVNKRMEIVSIESPTVKEPNKEEYEEDIKNMVQKYIAMSDKAKELELEHDSIRYINMASAYKRKQEADYEKILKLSKEYKVKNDAGWFQFRGTMEECEEYIKGELREGLLDGDIFYASAGMYKEAMKMLQKSDIVILPVFVFDHSGISISVSNYTDKWDSGQAGWIYTTKENVRKILINGNAKYKNENGNYVDVTEENWRDAAVEILKNEIKIYDQYLQGDVYGIITEEYDEENDDWEDADSCWGFYNDKWGDDLAKDIASDFGITETLYDDLNDARAA